MTTLNIPDLSLVVLIGPSGAGKSTFAARHFRPTEVLSSDVFRGMVGDDENDQSVTPQAFQALQAVAAQRLALGRLTVIDATSLQRGPEYLRIIYGPEYALPGNLERLRERNLGRKRSLAASEFALGVEALDRFTSREPLFRVHECVFGVLALESEPVDPRL